MHHAIEPDNVFMSKNNATQETMTSKLTVYFSQPLTLTEIYNYTKFKVLSTISCHMDCWSEWRGVHKMETLEAYFSNQSMSTAVNSLT